MKRIKCVIFDFCGVISLLQSINDYEETRKLADLDSSVFKELYFRYRPEYDSGLIDGLEYWGKVLSNRDIPNKNILIKQIIKLDVESWTRINNSVIQLVFRFQEVSVKIAILSNIHFDALKYIEEKYLWLENIDYKIYSCREKCIKPDKKIFLNCLSKISYLPEECLFIDDTNENIITAENLGFNTIHYTGYDELINEIESRYTFD